MDLSGRLKMIRESLSKTQKEMADALDVTSTSIQGYERGSTLPGAKVFEALTRMGFDINWLLTGKGEMRRTETNGHVANGNNIIQGAHIDAEEVHLEMRHAWLAAEKSLEYADPVSLAFLKDWCSLSDVAKMRVWTMVKEEIERERGKV